MENLHVFYVSIITDSKEELNLLLTKNNGVPTEDISRIGSVNNSLTVELENFCIGQEDMLADISRNDRTNESSFSIRNSELSFDLHHGLESTSSAVAGK